WREATGERGFVLPKRTAAEKAAGSIYRFFRVQSLQSQSAVLHVGGPAGFKIWQNGQALETAESEALTSLEPGSNDFLVRLELGDTDNSVETWVQAAGNIAVVL